MTVWEFLNLKHLEKKPVEIKNSIKLSSNLKEGKIELIDLKNMSKDGDAADVSATTPRRAMEICIRSWVSERSVRGNTRYEVCTESGAIALCIKID